MRRLFMTARRGSLIVGSLVVAMSFVFVPLTSASTAKAKTCTSGAGTKVKIAAVCSGLSYFAGKTITIISPGGVGGSFDNSARSIANGMSTYLHADVVVTDISAGVTVPGQDAAASSQPNGLTLGELNVEADIESFVQKTAGIDFPLKTAAIVGGFPPQDVYCVSVPSSPLKNIHDVITSPTQLKVLNLATGATGLQTDVILGAYNISATQITGFANAAAMTQGFIGNDGDLGCTSASAWTSLVIGGQARVVLQSNVPPAGQPVNKYLAGVPTYESLYKSDPPKTTAGKAAMKELVALVDTPNTDLFAPVGTPANLVETLGAAMKWTTQQQATKAYDDNTSLTPGYVSPKTVKSELNVDIKHLGILGRYLG
jgi:tripartite-type tricarboxylate transporter receptor subunit TctC